MAQLAIDRRTIADAPAQRTVRVCHVMTADLWAGAEVQVMTLAAFLNEQPQIELFVVLFNEGAMARELRGSGVRVAVIDERSHGAGEIVGFLARYFSAHRIDVVHTHRYKDNLLSIVAAKVAGVRHVVRTVHGLMEPARGWAAVKSSALTALDSAALSRFADLVIGVSRHTAAVMRSKGCRSARHVYNGIDLTKVKASRSGWDVRAELGIAPNVLLFGTAGRLTAVKAQHDFLYAANVILKHEPAAAFLIAGEGVLGNDLRSLARRLGIESHVCFTGERRDVFDLIAALDVFVLPSLAEGIPMVLLEAMALGTPVVATAVGGVPEMITNGETGVLVPPGDPAALAEACLNVARRCAWAQRLAIQARRTVESQFSREANGTLIMDAYRAVAAASAGRRPSHVPERPGTARLCAALIRAALVHVSQRCRRALAMQVERRRMRRIRRNPAPLTQALRSARRILIACQGNIIRSPFAARLVADALRDQGRWSILSAGLSAVAGRPPHPTAVHIATARSVDLSDHEASPVAAAAVASSDVIFVMDVAQLVALHERFPEARGRAFLLACLAPDAPLEITDPIDGDEARFESCFDHISLAVRPIVQTLGTTPGLQ